MTEWISLVFPWLFVTNAFLFGALQSGSYGSGARKPSCSFEPPSALPLVLSRYWIDVFRAFCVAL
jgi:hypothetical protein